MEHINLPRKGNQNVQLWINKGGWNENQKKEERENWIGQTQEDTAKPQGHLRVSIET